MHQKSRCNQRTQSADLSEENNLLADHAASKPRAKNEDYEDDTDAHVSESSSCPENKA